MLLGFVFAGMVLAAPPVGGDGALARTGDALGDAIVTGVETHPEFERYALRQPDGRVAVAELTTGAGGLCEHGGLTLFPRPELAEGVLTTVGMDALCERLAERRPTLRARIGEGGAALPGSERAGGGGPGAEAAGGGGVGGWPTDEGLPAARSPGSVEVHAPRVDTPLSAVLLVLVVLAVARARPDRMLVGVGLAALVARLALSPRGVTNGALAGYEKLALARGTVRDPAYGEAWGALLGAVPGWPDGVFVANLLLGSLSAALLAAFVRGVAGARAGLAAGLFLALLPTHVGVSASETMHVSVLAFELVSVLAALAWARGRALSDGLIAALAAGFAVHLRPDALPFVVVPLIWAVVGRSAVDRADEPRAVAPIGGVRSALGYGLPVATLLGLVAWRVALLRPGGDVLRLPDWRVLLPRLGEARADAASFQLFAHADFTPPVLWGLAVLGVASLWRAGSRGAVAALAVWIVVTTLPVSAKVWPLVDAIRLQLPGQAPWVALAAIGAAALPRWVVPATLLAFLPYYPLRPWVQTEEWRFLRATVPTLPAGTTIRYDPRPQRAASFAAVMEALGPARWSAHDGELRYVGLDCRARGGCDTSGCIAETVARLEGRVDLDLALEERTIGFWRCSSEAEGR